MKKIVLLILFLNAFLLDASAMDYTFKGFGSLQASFNSDNSTFTGIGNEVTLEEGSRLAGQLNLSLTDDFSFAYQGSVKPDYLNDYDIKYFTDLAFISFQPVDFFQTRIGQLRTPFYMNSEFLDTNFLMPWNTLPVTVYGQVPILKYRGFDFIFSSSFNDDLDYEIQIAYGDGEESFLYINPVTGQQNKLDLEGKGNLFTTVTLFWGDYTFRINHSHGQANSGNDIPFYLPSNAFPKNDKNSFNSIGFKFEDEKYLFMAEYATRRIRNSFFIEPTNGYYITAGYKYLNFMPSLTYGHSKTPDSLSKSNDITNNLSFFSASLKWDIAPHVDIKLEYSHYNNSGQGNTRYQFNIFPNETGIRPEDFDITTLSVNFIF